MSPFDSYAKTLSYHLPIGLRDDVIREVMDDLYSELETENQLTPGESTEYLMSRVLSRHQSPRALARSFAKRRSELIGPRVFPIYKWTLWVSLVTTLVIVASLSLLSGYRWQIVGDLSLSAIVVFAVITLAFLAIDRLGPLNGVAEAMALNRQDENEDPVEEDKETFVNYRCNRRIIAIGLLICLNLIPDKIGLLMLITKPTLHVAIYPILSEAFLGLPRTVINIWCALVLALDLLVSMRGFARFEIKVENALQLAGLIVVPALLMNGHIFAVPHTEVTSQYGGELRDAMSSVIAPSLFQILMSVLWLIWFIKAWVFCMRLKRSHLLRTS